MNPLDRQARIEALRKRSKERHAARLLFLQNHKTQRSLQRVPRKVTKEIRESFVPQNHPFYPQEIVYIYGGGSSLKDFDNSLLKNKFVIGCNDAYQFGAELINVLTFADSKWWTGFGKVKGHGGRVLESYKGLVVSPVKVDPNVHWIKRFPRGLHTDGVGFNFSTGALAVNLALLFGAKKVILLGIDMYRGKTKENNWHPSFHPGSVTSQKTYDRHTEGFKNIKKDLSRVFPGCEIINANLDSKLECFSKMNREEALQCF
jgi:hypothetical protein